MFVNARRTNDEQRLRKQKHKTFNNVRNNTQTRNCFKRKLRQSWISDRGGYFAVLSHTISERVAFTPTVTKGSNE